MFSGKLLTANSQSLTVTIFELAEQLSKLISLDDSDGAAFVWFDDENIAAWFGSNIYYFYFFDRYFFDRLVQIGRASCRERV